MTILGKQHLDKGVFHFRNRLVNGQEASAEDSKLYSFIVRQSVRNLIGKRDSIFVIELLESGFHIFKGNIEAQRVVDKLVFIARDFAVNCDTGAENGNQKLGAVAVLCDVVEGGHYVAEGVFTSFDKFVVRKVDHSL